MGASNVGQCALVERSRPGGQLADSRAPAVAMGARRIAGPGGSLWRRRWARRTGRVGNRRSCAQWRLWRWRRVGHIKGSIGAGSGLAFWGGFCDGGELGAASAAPGWRWPWRRYGGGSAFVAVRRPRRFPVGAVAAAVSYRQRSSFQACAVGWHQRRGACGGHLHTSLGARCFGPCVLPWHVSRLSPVVVGGAALAAGAAVQVTCR